MSSPTAELLGRFTDAADDEVDAPGGQPVLSPADVDEAAAILRLAAELRIPCLFWGGGTHQGYGHAPDAQVVVTTRRLNRILQHEVEDLTVVVEAGVTVRELEASLAEHGQTAVLPEVSDSATVGGFLAAGLSSWQRFRYGPSRDRVLETKLVTGDGRLVTSGGRVVKNVTGYDIPRLCVGSFGSLGLIGAATLKLWPLPALTGTVTLGEELDVLGLVFRPLAVIETGSATKVYLGGTEPDVVAHVESLGGEFEEGLAWPRPLQEENQVSLKVPASLVSEAVARVRKAEVKSFRAAHGVGVVEMGHGAGAETVFEEIRGWAESAGGSLVVMSGCGSMDPWGTPPASVDLQRAVKAAFDPVGVANPGRLPGRL